MSDIAEGTLVRIAWFSPMPPGRSGIAAYSAEILPLLRARYDAIDVFVERDAHGNEASLFNAHDFVWKHRRRPYDLTIFQMGNASCHDYMWAYLFNYPGIVVLHDAQLHQARAQYLTRWRARRDDYLAEFHANHPDAPEEIGYLVYAGLGESLYHHWPLIRLVVESARLTVVHNDRVRRDLAASYPAATVDTIRMGVAEGDGGRLRGTEVARGDGGPLGGRRSMLERRGIPADAVVITAFGGVTPEKRIGPLLRALAAMRTRHSRLHLLVAGDEAEHLDVMSEARRWDVADRVHVTGYVNDEDVTRYLMASDICACLRWPTNREISASWLRCLAAGRATIITELAHLVDVPTLDPHDWRLRDGSEGEPVAVSVDIVDEDHSLHLALDRLASDDKRRALLGKAARAWWNAHHRLELMAADYARIIERAVSLPAPRPALPAHLRDDGTSRLAALTRAVGIEGFVNDTVNVRATETQSHRETIGKS